MKTSYSTILFLLLATLPLSADEPSAAPAAASAPIAATAPAPVIAPADRTIDQAELTTMLTEVLQKDYVKERGELELKLTQKWVTKKISDEPVEVKILEMPTMGVVASFILRFELRNAHGSLGTWQTLVQAHIWREAWVAHAPLQRGDSLAGAELARERRDMLLIHEPLADLPNGTAQLEVAEPVGIGAPLLARSVRLTPVVHRGQTVQALVEDGALSIAMKVEVLEDGAPGQIVRARNRQTLRDIRGKVLNEQTIVVSL